MKSSILFKDESEIDSLKIIIIKILESIFEEQIKQKTEQFDNRLSFACPYCGDSKKNINLKRANIYFVTSSFHCFNCGVHKSLENFLNDYNYIIKNENFDFIKFNKNQNFYNNKESRIDLIFDNKIDEYLIDKKEIEKTFNFREINELNLKKYLNSRLYFNFNNFSYDPSNKALVIYNINKNNRVFGFQIRLFKSYGPKYLSYKLSSIYSKMNKEINEIVEKYDHLSLFFNILNIDYSKIVTIFEGPLDAYLFFNSISLSGVGKNLPFNFEKQQFFFDNDESGKKKSYELLDKKESIFLWNKFFNDYKIKKKIKDFNELMIYLNKNNLKLKYHDFDDYFSNKKIDLIMV